MKNSSSRRPITIEAARFKESVSLFEQEVILNQLVLNSFVHSF